MTTFYVRISDISIKRLGRAPYELHIILEYENLMCKYNATKITPPLTNVLTGTAIGNTNLRSMQRVSSHYVLLTVSVTMHKDVTNSIAPINLYSYSVTPWMDDLSFICFCVRTHRTRQTNMEYVSVQLQQDCTVYVQCHVCALITKKMFIICSCLQLVKCHLFQISPGKEL